MTDNKQTRSKTKIDEKESKNNEHKNGNIIRESSKRVFIFNEQLLESINNGQIQRLRNPRTEKHSFYIINKLDKTIFELIEFGEPNRSWLIDETISSNGKLYITIPFDITFFILYYFKKFCSTNAIPINQIQDDEYPLFSELLKDFINEDILNKIGDQKGPKHLIAFKYNREKSLAWLAIKVKKLVNKLKLKNIYTGSSAVSANYTKSEKFQEIDNNEYIKYAIGFIGNYLTNDFEEDLLNYFNIKDENPTKKRKSMQNVEEILAKKIKIDENNSTIVEKPIEKKITIKEKALNKAAKGSKSITSFFKK